MTLLTLIIIFSLSLASFLARKHWALRQRHATLARLLDLADDVEALLSRSQSRMIALQTLLTRVPNDISAVAQASLESQLPIKEAKRDVLQHRLWIQKNSASAEQTELNAAAVALERAQQKLRLHLENLESVGIELAIATQAATKTVRREPASLYRNSDK